VTVRDRPTAPSHRQALLVNPLAPRREPILSLSDLQPTAERAVGVRVQRADAALVDRQIATGHLTGSRLRERRDQHLPARVNGIPDHLASRVVLPVPGGPTSV
jgi:hypothetical protein